jgi:SNF2 family DNA or RNA helicase
MVNIKDFKNLDSEDILRNYDGNNPYINYMKKKLLTEKKYFLSNSQSNYVKNYYNFEPYTINKVIEITDYYGDQLKEEHKLKVSPKKILFDIIIAESDKAYHVIGKLYKNQKDTVLLWVPKTQMIDDVIIEKDLIKVNFDKYPLLDKRGWKPFNHQIEGVEFLVNNEKCILAHEPGLGKTYQSIVAALEMGAERILVICPSTLKINWGREIQNFTDDVTIIKNNVWDPSRFTIMNYDVLKNFHTVKEKNREYEDWELKSDIVDYNPDLIILDEAHYVKNHKSIRGKIIKDVVKQTKCEKVWLLTGTPIANRPMDFYNLLSLIDSPVANNYVHYVKRYCDGKRFKQKGKFVWVAKGATNLEELYNKTRRTILIKKKEDALDLPEKMVIPYYLELENVDGYKNVWNQYLEKRRRDGKKGNITKDLVELGLLRKFIAMETVPHSIEKADEVIDNGKKVIIFCNFSDEMDAFSKHFGKKSVCLRGGMTDKQKQHAVDRFQEDDTCMVFIGQIIAAGVGITLNKAEVVIMNSLDWVPGNHEQAEDRCIYGGQRVLTMGGYKLIENIVVGDLVYTHLGNFKKVIETHTHLEINKNRIDIIASGGNRLSLTEDHKIYVYDTKNKIFEWVEGRNLDIDNHCLTFKSRDLFEKRIKGYLTYPINSINISKPKINGENVYDLTVEDDHSFVVDNYNVHNCHRIGQDNKIFIYYMLMYNTIDTLVWNVLQSKKKVISTIMGETPKINEEEIITEILKNIEDGD